MSIESTPESPRARIRELRLRRFRAFENARLILNDFTVIVGRNGSGKTTLTEAFDFLRDSVTHGVLTALERRGGIGSIVHRPSKMAESFVDGSHEPFQSEDDGYIATPSDVEIAIDLKLPATGVIYGFTIGPFESRAGFCVKREILRTYPKESFSFERTGLHFTTKIRDVTPLVSPEALVLPLVADQEAIWRMTVDVLRSLLVYEFSPQAMQSEPQIGSQQALTRDGSNIGDVLFRVDADRVEMDWILRHMECVTPGITWIKAGASAGRRIVNFLQRTGSLTSTFVASAMSNGTLHSLGVLLALRQKPVPSLVFVDEIESSIHTAALSALMDAAAVTAEERCQVVISSHSTDALSHRAVTAQNVRIVDWQDDRSFVFHVGEGARDLLKPPETVGRLLRSNALWTEDAPMTVKNDIFEVDANG